MKIIAMYLTSNNLCQDPPAVKRVRQSGHVAAIYYYNWYIGFVPETDADSGGTKVNFMHPKKPVASFHFPNHENVCWIPTSQILCCIERSTLVIA